MGESRADGRSGVESKGLDVFKDLILAGPAPAPVLRAETFYRYQIMLRTARMSALGRQLAKIIESFILPEEVALSVDIDPADLG